MIDSGQVPELVKVLIGEIRMRNKFDMQLSQLNDQMSQMGTMIEDAITRAVDAMSRADVATAKEIMENDVQVDRMQKQIESICFNLLVQQQPVARDLRTITAAMKMVTDMERIGDHAADISEMTILMAGSGRTDKLEHINKMASETILMLNWSIEAYVSRDKEKAQAVIDHDDVVDALFVDTKKDIIDLILKDPDAGEEVIDLLMVAKYFERIGDHATNIAEWVIYSMKTSEEEQ